MEEISKRYSQVLFPARRGACRAVEIDLVWEERNRSIGA